MSFTREPGVGPSIGATGRAYPASLRAVPRQASNRSQETECLSAPSVIPRSSFGGIRDSVVRRRGATGLSARAATTGNLATAATRRGAASSPAAPTAARRDAGSLSRRRLLVAMGTAPLPMARLSLDLGPEKLAPLSLISRVSCRKH